MNSKNDPESIESIIEQLSTNGKECLDVVYVKKLKSFCKNLNESKQIETYNYIGKLIFHQLKSNHAQIRYGSLLIIEYLFERSHQYRVFLCQHIDRLFKFCLNLNGFQSVDSEFPKQSKSKDQDKRHVLRPILWAEKLKTKMIEIYKYWYQEFVRAYPILKNGFEFLVKNGLINTNQQVETSTSVSINS